jgi:hypothetical protein
MNKNEAGLAPEGAANEGYRRTGTLNDYRIGGVVAEPTSSIGMMVGSLVIVAAVGFGAYMYYTSHHPAPTSPAVASVNPAPAGAAPTTAPDVQPGTTASPASDAARSGAATMSSPVGPAPSLAKQTEPATPESSASASTESPVKSSGARKEASAHRNAATSTRASKSARPSRPASTADSETTAQPTTGADTRPERPQAGESVASAPADSTTSQQ